MSGNTQPTPDAIRWARDVLDKLGLGGLEDAKERQIKEVEKATSLRKEAREAIRTLTALKRAAAEYQCLLEPAPLGTFVTVGEAEADYYHNPNEPRNGGVSHLWGTPRASDGTPRVDVWRDRQVEAGGIGAASVQEAMVAKVRKVRPEYADELHLGVGFSASFDRILRLETERSDDAERHLRKVEDRAAAADALHLDPTGQDAAATVGQGTATERVEQLAVELVKDAEAGVLPPFHRRTTGDFHEWCGDKIGKSRTTARRALDKGGVLVTGQQGGRAATLRAQLEGLLRVASDLSEEYRRRVENIENGILNPFGSED